MNRIAGSYGFTRPVTESPQYIYHLTDDEHDLLLNVNQPKREVIPGFFVQVELIGVNKSFWFPLSYARQVVKEHIYDVFDTINTVHRHLVLPSHKDEWAMIAFDRYIEYQQVMDNMQEMLVNSKRRVLQLLEQGDIGLAPRPRSVVHVCQSILEECQIKVTYQTIESHVTLHEPVKQWRQWGVSIKNT